jgi:hypothetical protein
VALTTQGSPILLVLLPENCRVAPAVKFIKKKKKIYTSSYLHEGVYQREGGTEEANAYTT